MSEHLDKSDMNGHSNFGQALRRILEVPIVTAMLASYVGVVALGIFHGETGLEVIAAAHQGLQDDSVTQAQGQQISTPNGGTNQSTVVSPLRPSPSGGPRGSWKITGRVLADGEAVADALIWVIVTDDLGNRYSPQSQRTGKDGDFVVEKIPPSLIVGHAIDLREARIYASADAPWYEGGKKKGESVLPLRPDLRFRLIQPARFWIMPLLGWLALSILFAMLTPSLISWKRKYYLSMAMAGIFTAWMIYAIAEGQTHVSTTSKSGEVLSLGFATIFEGTYIQGVQSEWLISLTAASQASSGISTSATSTASLDMKSSSTETVMHGLGAPLWVILLAVIGASLFTVVLIVTEIGLPLDFAVENEEKVRERIKTIVLHQLYIAFAPLGGIFVYQALVLGNAASQPITVGLAALGAGATLNVVLGKAVAAAEKVWK